MTPATMRAGPRWTMSFADLCLVLLAFLLLLQANKGNPAAVGAGIRAAFGAKPPTAIERPAAPMFEGGEAMLLPGARSEMIALGGAAAARHASVRIESRGNDGGGRRFDGWELAAARAAAVARAIQAGGLDAARIDLAVAGTHDDADAGGQRLRITTNG